MQTLKNKIAAVTIAIFFMLSMTASMMLIPSASTHTPPWKIPTFAYIYVAPNPIGVGQTAHIYMWLDKIPYGAAMANDIRFHNYKLTITAPDGTNTTQTIATVEDTTSAQYTSFTPTKVGTYTFTFNFPGQLYTWTGIQPTIYGPEDVSAYTGDTYLPSSASTNLTVTQEQLTAPVTYPPLPTAYWTRPIYGLNTSWYTVSNNWLGAPDYWDVSNNAWAQPENFGENVVFPDVVGPLTSHVMWTKPIESGGVVGGNLVSPGAGYFEGTAYIVRFENPIIMDGMLFYNEPISFTGDSTGPCDCVNLQTGQLIWSNPNITTPTFGMVWMVNTPNQHGVFPPLLVSASSFYGLPFGTWEAFDAYTGDWVFNVTNVPQFSLEALGPSGETLIYTFNNAGTPTSPNWQLCEWNSSKLWYNGVSALSGEAESIIPPVSNAAVGTNYDWNASLPWMNTMTTQTAQVYVSYDNLMLCYNSTNGQLPSAGTGVHPASSAPYTWFAINLNATRGPVGSVLWWNTLQPPAGNLTVTASGWDPTNGVFVESYKEARQFVGYSLKTGAYMWGPTPSADPMDYYGNVYGGDLNAYFAYGNMYYSGFGGIVYCYNELTGKLKWTYGNGGSGNSTNADFYVPQGHYPTMPVAICDGVLYTVTGEHTATDPIIRGALTRAINATTGQEIWTLSDYDSSWPGLPAFADGYMAAFNGYDDSIYCVGRGPSATTVTAPNAGLSFGQSVVISGTVMDVSAGTKQTEQAADFPNGVPCASDASMTQWMGYVYQQQAKPTNFTGVTVSIDAIDPNGNYVHLGKATTDSSGTYIFTVTPSMLAAGPGTYKVIATFAGTNGYWPSSAECGFTFTPAPTVAPTASPITGLVGWTSFEMGIALVVIVVIVIGAIIIILMLRKRP